MKIITSLLLIVFAFFLTATQLTVYNNNFALVKDNLDMDLQSGKVDFNFSKIPQTIEANSVILNSQNSKLQMLSQNFEFDLANTDKILQKYIKKEITVHSKDGNIFTGELQFFDIGNLGILEKTTDRLQIINRNEVLNLNLSQLPENFYLKPTLHWKFNSPKAQKYKAEISYLCRNISWEVTYNTVWNEKELTLNSWVTLTNNSGKSFSDTKLKLVAGEVQKLSQRFPSSYKNGRMVTESTQMPEFEEKSFHDFHLYTLSEKVDIKNKQTKQLKLFPTTKVDAASKYVYQTFANKVQSLIVFKNSAESGLGIPLPKGNIKVYKQDEADDQMEFIGEDKINHTAKDEEVEISTGFAFDLVAETKVLNQRKLGRNAVEKDMQVTLKNHSDKAKTIVVEHFPNGDWQIFNENVKFEKKSAHKIVFQLKLQPDEISEITWTERINY
jgi:hypothetical protein